MSNAQSSQEIFDRIADLIAPFNKKNIPIVDDTRFATDLELDSLAVMDLVAAIEDEFDIILPLNMLPSLETVRQVADAVEKIMKEK